MIQGAVTRVTDNYKISEDTLEIRTWNKEQSIVWADVTEVDVIPTFFGEPNMIVTTVGSKPKSISTSYFANTKTLNQAILEAAHLHNDEVKVGKFALIMYGPPPYGIFTCQKADS